MTLYIANLSIDGFHLDEIVDIDPLMWADYIEAEYLTPVNELGQRILTVEPHAAFDPPELAVGAGQPPAHDGGMQVFGPVAEVPDVDELLEHGGEG